MDYLPTDTLLGIFLWSDPTSINNITTERYWSLCHLDPCCRGIVIWLLKLTPKRGVQSIKGQVENDYTLRATIYMTLGTFEIFSVLAFFPSILL